MAAHVLVVDDDPAERHRIEQTLQNQGYGVETTGSGDAALRRLQQSELPPISAMILDLVMPDLDGMAVLERLGRRGFAIPVIVQTAPGGVDSGASAMRAGAFDFLVKPAGPERIRASLGNALKMASLENEVLKMRLGRSGTLSLADLAIRAPSMERALQLAGRAARSSIPVLLEGERGVGKEFLARAIHASSARRGKPFVSVRCGGEGGGAALGEILSRENRSTVAAAAGGTLFLHEIASLDADSQRVLARALAYSGVAPGRHTLPGDVRLIAATSRRLIDRATEKAFREELFNRLNVLPIWVPPLRERSADIADFAQGLVVRIAAEVKRPDVTGISPTAMDLMLRYDWPGNIRELEQVVFRAVMLSGGGELSPEDFPSLIAARGPAGDSQGSTSMAQPVADQKQLTPEPVAALQGPTDRRAFARYGLARLLDERGEMRSFDVLEEEVIRFAIDHYSGRMSEVARRLGIGRSTLYRKIRDYGIAPEQTVAS